MIISESYVLYGEFSKWLSCYTHTYIQNSIIYSINIQIYSFSNWRGIETESLTNNNGLNNFHEHISMSIRLIVRRKNPQKIPFNYVRGGCSKTLVRKKQFQVDWKDEFIWPIHVKWWMKYFWAHSFWQMLFLPLNIGSPFIWKRRSIKMTKECIEEASEREN